ncbi:transcriptional regulator, MarR family [Williamwhitmania taraxaci]|uniref:HTH-type transcriptional regulator SarZ n=1 Tax=Williamwhitmania taraxaci TaxID=1640674 RepID=A0A1G6QML2_9BACT|nr:transcriptional regulator, MarR family [Williamwhitmania taraxaci]
MEYDQLKLSNQLCFPVYAASRLITREYQPYLDKMGITYPQYLVLLVLWETDGLSVNEIAQKLLLNTNTVTPLLKRMEMQGIISRNRSENDERKVIVLLTDKGKDMRIEASSIPENLAAGMNNESMKMEDLVDLRDKLNILITFLLAKNKAIE